MPLAQEERQGPGALPGAIPECSLSADVAEALAGNLFEVGGDKRAWRTKKEKHPQLPTMPCQVSSSKHPECADSQLPFCPNR